MLRKVHKTFEVIFFSLLLNIIHFSFITLNSRGVPYYSARKPVVYKLSASI